MESGIFEEVSGVLLPVAGLLTAVELRVERHEPVR